MKNNLYYMVEGIDPKLWTRQLRALDLIDGTADKKQAERKIQAAANKIELIRAGCLTEGVPFQQKWRELLSNPPKGFTREQLEQGMEMLKQENPMWAEYENSDGDN